MAHTRRLSARQGLPLLTLILIGALPLISMAQNPSDAPAETETAPIVIDMAAPLEPERANPPSPEPSTLGVYRNYIEYAEDSAGAFAPGLSEQLLGLGLNLQALDRHAEAATVLKRGVHVSRVQSGLYAPDQIPLLRAEIRSLVALGQFDEVDEHQRYLSRVESEALRGTPASIGALLDQAAWAEQAWELRLGEQEAHPEHLARSWEYYRLAYNQSSDLYGPQSMELLKPLEGMLRLQYRFAELQRANASGSAFDGPSNRQASLMGGTYRRGEAVLVAIHGLKLFNGVPAGEQARDLVRLGDWAHWMGRRSDARSYYAEAWHRITPPPEAPKTSEEGEKAPADSAEGTALADSATDAYRDNESQQRDLESDDAVTEPANTGPELAKAEVEQEQRMVAEAASPETTQQPTEDTTVMALPEEPAPEDDPVMRTALFAAVTPLPDIDSLRPLPPSRPDASGPLVVQFQLNEAGKITELERITVTTVTQTDSAEAETAPDADNAVQVKDDPVVARLLRKMRRTRFRPRYEGGEAVDTGMIVWSFDLSPTATEAMALQP